MKCPKCGYLGFETGDRCRNCGYDFSLTMPAPVPDVTADGPSSEASRRVWLDEIDEAKAQPQTAAPLSPPRGLERAKAPALPLFKRGGEDDDDEPLIKLPPAPRAPLSVRKTPDTPRPRAAAKPAPPVEVEPILQFAEASPIIDLPLRDGAVDDAPRTTPASPRVSNAYAAPSGTAARVSAALIDHGILLAIDAGVVYFTLRMAALPMTEWHVLPPAPLLAFLALVKFAYFCAFTAVGGQTIGKMALGIRVVTDADAAVDGACAVRRTIAGIAALALGIGFLPALFSAERRAFHDRVARTRVVALRSF